MRELTNFVFFKNADVAGASGIAYNSGGDALGVQVSGTFTGLSLEVQGRVDVADETNNNFVTLSVLDMTTFDVGGEITKAGVYEVPVETQKQVRLVIKSIASGSVQVFGRFVNTAG